MSFPIKEYTENIIKLYLEKFPNDKSKIKLLLSQLENNEDIWHRKNFTWHVTATGFVISPDKKQTLIIHNINVNKWVSPGWHYEDGDDEIHNCATREVKEETRLKNILLSDWHEKNKFIPININSHKILANEKKQEWEHYHHDFRFAFFLTEDEEINIDPNELYDFEWRSIDDDLGKTNNDAIDNIKAFII